VVAKATRASSPAPVAQSPVQSPIVKSPKVLTMEEKVARDEYYRVDSKEFTKRINELINDFNTLMRFSFMIGKAGKSGKEGKLSFKGREFTDQDLKADQQKFKNTLRNLKHYLRMARKKTRKPLAPSSFKNTYAPSLAGDALRAFFTNGNFGPLDRADPNGRRLIDFLPNLRDNGMLLKNTATVLFNVYARANALQGGTTPADKDNRRIIRSDNVMKLAFGEQIPAEFYTWKVQQPGASKPRTFRVRMDDAANTKQIPKKLNTYDTVKASHPNFNQSEFNSFYFPAIISVNLYSIEALMQHPDEEMKGFAEDLADEKFKQAMLDEHNLAYQANQSWIPFLPPPKKSPRKPKDGAAPRRPRGKKEAAPVTAQ
jgi:preprotein translocase subunit Sss1